MHPSSKVRGKVPSPSAPAPSLRARFVDTEHVLFEEASSHSTSLTGTTPTQAHPHPNTQKFPAQGPQHRHGLSSPRPPSPYPLPQGPPSEANDTPSLSARPSPEPSPARPLRCSYPDEDDNISTVSTTSSGNSNPNMNPGKCWKCRSSLIRTGLGPSRVTCVECWQEQPQQGRVGEELEERYWNRVTGMYCIGQ
jgi:hypothetical protein